MFTGINLVCLPNESSYGKVSTNVIKQLDKMGVRVSLFPIIQDCHQCQTTYMSAAPENHELIKRCLENAQTFDPDAPSVRLWHQFALAEYPAPRSLKAAWPIFELDQFNPLELHHLKAQQRIIVCSHWAKTVLQDNHVDVPTYVVPLGVDDTVFHPNEVRKNPDSTCFYTVGKWEARKLHDQIKVCFDRAFSPNDNVELHMFTTNRLLPKEKSLQWEKYYRRGKLSDKVVIHEWFTDERQLAGAISSLDCGLFVSRAEGFNLGLLESMAMGKQVIVTNYSAHTEYANEKNSLLVQIDKTEPAYDGIWFFNQGNWGFIGPEQEEQIIEHMKSVHKKKQAGDNLFNEEGVKTAQTLSWENTATKLMESLQ